MFSTWRRDKEAGRAATILTVSSATVLNLTVAFLVHSAFPGLRFTPGGDEPQAATKAGASSVADVAQRTGRTPAEVVLSLVLDAPPALPAGARPVSALQGVPSSPVDQVCGTRAGPAPVTAAGRGWAVAKGSQLANLRAGYTVTVAAYGAGQGAVAFSSLARQVNEHCANRSGTAYLVGGTGAGVDAATARINRSGGGTTAFFWRRGDIVAMVASTGPTAAMGMVREYDARIAAALVGVCVTTDSAILDARRSPYVNRSRFTGLTVAAPVPLPLGVFAPKPVKSQPVVDLPTVNRPDAPASPFWPERLPSPVQTPEAPKVPRFPVLNRTVGVRVLDTQGPGCGWSFTGQLVPRFDAAAASAKAAADLEAGTRTLDKDIASYVAKVPDYRAAYSRYLAEVRDFRSYAQAVDTVAAAWDVIRMDQAQYREAVDRYTAAMAARDAFLVTQAAARYAYERDLALCAGRIPAPPPTPIAVPTTVPTTVPPTATPTAPPTTAPPLRCPPVPAQIITQTAPPLPQPPTPPADPRPRR